MAQGSDWLETTSLYSPNAAPEFATRGAEDETADTVNLPSSSGMGKPRTLAQTKGTLGTQSFDHLHEILPANMVPQSNAGNPRVHAPEGDQWYFGMAAMMNPISLEGRDLKPIKSMPGELLNYGLAFEPLAVAYPKQGASFHGVLHYLSAKDVQNLDTIELSMGRKNMTRSIATARLYDGTTVECTIYEDVSYADVNGNRHLPSQRYVDIMIEGAKHFGVNAAYIEELGKLPTLPRPQEHEYRTFEVPPQCRTLSWDDSRQSWCLDRSMIDVNPETGEVDLALQLSINGKVLQWVGPRDTAVYKALKAAAGTDITLSCAKLKYDPKFGIPRRHEDMTREHCLFVEDHFQSTPFAKYFRVVGVCLKPMPNLDAVAPRTALVSEALGGTFVNPAATAEADRLRRRGSHYHRPLPAGLLPASIDNVKFSVDQGRPGADLGHRLEDTRQFRQSFSFRAIGN